jgi:hypothetical protein
VVWLSGVFWLAQNVLGGCLFPPKYELRQVNQTKKTSHLSSPNIALVRNGSQAREPKAFSPKKRKGYIQLNRKVL